MGHRASPVTCRWIAVVRQAMFCGFSLVVATAFAGQAPAPPPPPPQGKAGAPFDLTGTWVSVVTEDWLWRMTTPKKGDASSIPLNAVGRQVTNEWDPSTDGSCKAFGAAALMRMPTRVRITWEADDVLKIETDAGQQTRRLIFAKPRPADGAKSLQGYSAATWQFAPRSVLRGEPPPTGGASLMVTTTDLTAGWLRRNGVPYSENARMTEYFDQFALPDGAEWFVVTTLVDDPQYLTQQYFTSTHFRKERDGSKWDPQPCKPIG